MSSEENLYEEYESDLGLDEEDRKAAKSDSDIEWYKGQKGKTDRASIIYFHPVNVSAVAKARKKTPNLSKDELVKIAAKALADRAASLNKTIDQLTPVEKLDTSEVHFKKFTSHFGGEGIGYTLSGLGKGTAEEDEVWKKLEPPKTHFSTLLIIYPSNKKGEIDKTNFANWKIVPWRFSPKRYDLIWKVNMGLVRNGASISNQDLLLECKDEKYQQIEPSADGPATWLKSEKFKQVVLAKAVDFYDKLVPFRQMTTAQLREKLGLSSGSSGAVQDVAAGSDFTELLDNV
jgi:hypothetical protein